MRLASNTLKIYGLAYSSFVFLVYALFRQNTTTRTVLKYTIVALTNANVDLPLRPISNLQGNSSYKSLVQLAVVLL